MIIVLASIAVLCWLWFLYKNLRKRSKALSISDIDAFSSGKSELMDRLIHDDQLPDYNAHSDVDDDAPGEESHDHPLHENPQEYTPSDEKPHYPYLSLPFPSNIKNNSITAVPKGTMGMTYDEKMKKFKTYKVQAEIAYPGAPLVFTISGEKISIELSDLMKCVLYGNHFDIKALHDEEQVILHNEPTLWRWNVIPLKTGVQELELIVSRKITKGHETGFHDKPVCTRYVRVTVNPAVQTTRFLATNWQWIVGTIAGSGVLWQLIKRGK